VSGQAEIPSIDKSTAKRHSIEDATPARSSDASSFQQSNKRLSQPLE